MCNRYEPATPSELAEYFGVQPPLAPYKRGLGPRGQGPFIRMTNGAPTAYLGQWALIGDDDKRPDNPKSTNNARLETIGQRATYKGPWQRGQRCLIPAHSFIEPYWFTDNDGNPVKSVWSPLCRADGKPWALAGLWNDLVDESGEVHLSYTMITMCCDEHPLLSRLHKPDLKLPLNKQDKRTVIPLDESSWEVWLQGSNEEAAGVLCLPKLNLFNAAALENLWSKAPDAV